MSHQLLNANDRKLLNFILDRHAEDGPIERSQLSVKARGIGVEVARSLLNLKNRGLVEEIMQRPGALRRLFGAKTLVLVGPTKAGAAYAASLEQETGATMGTTTDPEPPEGPGAAPVRDDQHAAVPAEQPVVPLIQPFVDMDREAVCATQPPAVPEGRPEPPAQVVPVPASAAPQVLRPAARTRLNAFTEDLGGVPVEEDLADSRPQVAPDVLDGLRETLTLFDMELTAAGEALIADRMSKGASQGEALCQVVLYAFAHAIHLAALGGCSFQPSALKDYAVGIMRALEALRDSSEIRDDRFEEDMRHLWALIGDGSDAQQKAETLLSDPIGGMAPSAVLPEEMLLSDDIDAGPL